MDTTNEITVKVFHISPISKFPCSQGNGTMEGKVPDRQQTFLFQKGGTEFPKQAALTLCKIFFNPVALDSVHI